MGRVFAMVLMGLAAHAQQADKKVFIFRGKVEKIEASPKPLTVTNEPVEGWMGPMTMAYAVDKPETIKQVKVGDQITAKVYEGDFILYDVQVLPPPRTEAPREKAKTVMRL